MQPGDLIIDSGNSYYKDSKRRALQLADKDLHFIGMGISGGGAGARSGPSLMAGGSLYGYQRIEGILRKIAASNNDGKPCCGYVGPEGSGHFVKMVQNHLEL